jgi:IclR family acetate operon transcriptional repressor
MRTRDGGEETIAVGVATVDSPILALLREPAATLLLQEGGWSRVRDDGGVEDGWSLSAATSLAWRSGHGQPFAALAQTGEVLSLRSGQTTPRRLATLPKASGRLGGLAVDGDGGVWTTLYEGWSVIRIAEDGAIDRVVGLPVPCPTDLAFGGRDGSRLYVTSARQSLSMEALVAAPLSGRLFRVETGIPGRSTLERLPA